MTFILFIIGLILGVVLCYCGLKPSLKETQQINSEIIEKNECFKRENNLLYQKNAELLSKKAELEKEQLIIQAVINESTNSLIKMQEQAQEAANNAYETSYKLAYEKMERAAEKMSINYNEALEEYKMTYLSTLEDTSQELIDFIALKQVEIQEKQKQLNELESKITASIQAIQREEEKNLDLKKYTINITSIDLTEIKRLREIAPFFRNPRAIYKIIWETYYRTLCTEMINRVVGSGIHTGIYKITNLTNQKTYIGQAADLSSRLKEHVKAGLGIDTPGNKLYTAMMSDGVENFSFEVIEECDRTKLNEQEAYWIGFYHSQEFGYNMTKGNSR